MSEEKQPSFLNVLFEDFGSTRFTIDLGNVSPMQMLALKEWLDFEARWQLQTQKTMAMRQMQVKETPKIIVPEPGMVLRE